MDIGPRDDSSNINYSKERGRRAQKREEGGEAGCVVNQRSFRRGYCSKVLSELIISITRNKVVWQN